MTNLLVTLFKANNGMEIDAESIMLHFIALNYTRHQAAGAIGNAIKRGDISVIGQTYCVSRNKMVNIFA